MCEDLDMSSGRHIGICDLEILIWGGGGVRMRNKKGLNHLNYWALLRVKI